MKIKEVESIVGIKSDTLHYYEKEGLIHPKRNIKNNYREYSEEDIERLQKIKTLRVLGIAIADIRELLDRHVELEVVLNKRLKEVDKEELYLSEIRKNCKELIRKEVTIEMLNESSLQASKGFFNFRIEEIMQKDIVSEKISRKELIDQMGIMLMVSCLINSVVGFFTTEYFLYHKKEIDYVPQLFWAKTALKSDIGIVMLLIVLALMGCIVAVWLTEKVLSLFIAQMLSSVLTTPYFLLVYRIIAIDSSMNIWISKEQVAFFWIMITFFIWILWGCSLKFEKLTEKMNFILLISFGCTALFTGISVLGCQRVILPAIAFTIATFYIAVKWNLTIVGVEACNRHYATVSVLKITNVFGFIAHGMYEKNSNEFEQDYEVSDEMEGKDMEKAKEMKRKVGIGLTVLIILLSFLPITYLGPESSNVFQVIQIALETGTATDVISLVYKAEAIVLLLIPILYTGALIGYIRRKDGGAYFLFTSYVGIASIGFMLICVHVLVAFSDNYIVDIPYLMTKWAFIRWILMVLEIVNKNGGDEFFGVMLKK